MSPSGHLGNIIPDEAALLNLRKPFYSRFAFEGCRVIWIALSVDDPLRWVAASVGASGTPEMVGETFVKVNSNAGVITGIRTEKNIDIPGRSYSQDR